MNSRRSVVLLFVIVVAIFALRFAFLKWRAWNVREHILKLDFESVLAGCRELIVMRPGLSSDWQDMQHLPGGTVVLDRQIKPYAKEVPSIIRELYPNYIIICKDHVFLNMCKAPRCEIIGFMNGVPQHGSVRLIDGLWLLTE